MRAALVALAVAGTLLGPAPADVSPIVFSSPGPPSALAAHRYEIGIDGSSRQELPQPDGFVSPDGRLVALVAGSETARTVEVGPFGGAFTSTIAIPGTNVDPPLIVWSPDSRRLAFGVASDCYTTSYKGGGCSTHEIRVARVGDDSAALVAPGRRPAWSGDGRRLAFVRASGKYGRDSIFVIPAAGGRERVLAPGEYPAWAPHGSEIAYVGGRGVMVLDADRPHGKRVISNVTLNGGPLWSPNGHLLAYVHQPIDSTKRWRLEVADVRTRRVHLIERGAFIGPIAWSPSSRLLAFATSQVFVAAANGGRPRQLTHELPWAVYSALSFASRDRVDYVTHQVESDDELYAVQPDGTGLVQLTNNLVEDTEPAWSPDGAHVAFVREPNTFNPAALDVLDPATGAVRTLVTIHGFQNGVFPAWSPDGTRIAYARGTKIAIAQADGKTLRLLATHGFPRRPTWSPDESEIAFADRAETELLVERTDGTGLHPVAPVSSADDAAWSPDGDWIAFSGRPTDTAEYGLWLVHPDGTGFRRLASSGEASAPAWSPDSSQLVYVSYVSGEGSTLRITAADGSGDRPLPLALTLPSWPAWRR